MSETELRKLRRVVRSSRKLASFFLQGCSHLLFQELCWGCGDSLGGKMTEKFCWRCLEELSKKENRCPWCGRKLGPYVASETCAPCKKKRPPLMGTLVLGSYQGLLGDLIRRLKFNRETEIASFLGNLLAHSLIETIGDRGLLNPTKGALIPVPLSKRRFRKRGFNQALLLCKAIRKKTGIPIEKGLLKRVRDTAAQSSLSFRERKTAIEGAFCAPKKLNLPLIFLVDDVITTGQTVWECSRALRERGAQKIFVLALAKS